MVTRGFRRRLARILRARHRDGDSGRARVTDEPRATFFSLTPDRVLEAVEVGGLRCTGRCLPLRAFENRVYEVELEDERRLVVKFYRPGRWSRAAILDEHAFLADLAAAEVPAVAPLDLGTGGTLGEIEGIYYAAFPKVRVRTLDELDAESRRRIGRPIGRRPAGGARISWRGTSSSVSSTARPSPSASRCGRCASCTCRAGSRGGGTIPRSLPPSRTSGTIATGCRSTRSWWGTARRSINAHASMRDGL